MYNAALGRWFVQDPLSEECMGLTPYNYVVNNPITTIDPNGMKFYNLFVNGEWNWYWVKNKDIIFSYQAPEETKESEFESGSNMNAGMLNSNNNKNTSKKVINNNQWPPYSKHLKKEAAARKEVTLVLSKAIQLWCQRHGYLLERKKHDDNELGFAVETLPVDNYHSISKKLTVKASKFSYGKWGDNMYFNGHKVEVYINFLNGTKDKTITEVDADFGAHRIGFYDAMLGDEFQIKDKKGNVIAYVWIMNDETSQSNFQEGQKYYEEKGRNYYLNEINK
jgi:hypothetical protein